MRRRRLPLGLLVPIALVAIVGTLATLQFRWLGQVSAAERDELRASLERRTREFSDDFDREISLAHSLFQARASGSDPSSADMIAAHFDQWRATSRHPLIVKAVHISRETNGERTLASFNAERRVIEPAAWPERLEPVRKRLPGLPHRPAEVPAPMNGVTQMFTFGVGPVVADVPALVIALPRSMQEHEEMKRTIERAASANVASVGNVLLGLRMGQDYLIVELDPAVLRDEMLPVLADRHFGTAYRVVVVDSKDTQLLTRGLAAGSVIDVKTADVVSPLFSLRMDFAREQTVSVSGSAAGSNALGWVTPAPQTGFIAATPGPGATMSSKGYSILVEQRATTPLAAVRVSRGGWQVLVQHRAGSLDAAVSQARRRNLWLSFGILTVLVASVGLIVLNARRSERLAAQQMDFVATVSHELRTPLAVIRAAAQNLSAGVISDAAQARRYGDLIEGEGRRLTDMVEQVLEYAGLSGNRRPLRARPVDAGELVRDVIATSAPLFESEGFAVSEDVDPATPPMLADEDAIRRALQNLVSNAIKYGGDGRWVGMSVKPATARGRSEVQVAVTDRGRGIDAADLPHLFEPFFRGQYAVERQIHGNGLGLSLVKRIAEAHGGRVTVKSAPGEGTTFTLHLPAATADVVRAAAPEPAESTGGSSAG
jgi:signal transduction histidine kinase